MFKYSCLQFPPTPAIPTSHPWSHPLLGNLNSIWWEYTYPRKRVNWSMYAFIYNNYYFYPHPRTCSLILEGGSGWKKGRETLLWERNIDWLSLRRVPTMDQISNLGLSPALESNPWHFGSWDDAPTNWAKLARAEDFLSDIKRSKNWFF